MRCLSCNCVLTDFEATRKGANTGNYIDLCNRCFKDIAEDMHVIERSDLRTEGDLDGNAN
jgi:hypothetical protein